MESYRTIIKYIFILLLTLFSACEKEANPDPKIEKSVEDSLYERIEASHIDSMHSTQIEEGITSPKLTIIIDDFGNYNNFMLDSLLVKFGELPTEVAFAILPNLPYSQFVMDYFQIQDRELLLHTPLQPQNNKINAGEVVISCKDDTITIINKLNSFYKELPNVTGLNNHMGSKTTENLEVMTTVLEWCKENDLFFVDSSTTAKSVAFDLARELGVPTAKRDIFLDVPNPTKATVDNYLIEMKKYFNSNKNILVITHASSLERRDNLLYFIEEALKIGFSLVHVSEYLTLEEGTNPI